MNLLLIGYRGSGKTTVGRLLAAQLDRAWVDCDREIERREKRSIADIFADGGEPLFRDLESEVVHQLVAEENNIISLGGGAVLREENRRAISGRGLVIYLSASAETLYQRIGNDASTSANRPQLTSQGGLEEVRCVLASRSDLYQQTADLQIDTEGKTPQELCQEIIERLGLAHDEPS